MEYQPFISVIIPVYNGCKYLNRCLDALMTSSYRQFEIIVVDDASTDDSVDICRKKGIAVVQMPHQSGPAAARNYGAQKARGDVLLFIDSDVLVQQETITLVAADFINNPDIVAIFGSYDDSPDASDFLSQFRNLFHHFIHQNSHQEAKTFWTGCGAIYKEIFYQLKGFDEDWFSIEDIELGHRIWDNGYRIMLDKEIQVKHLKQWGLKNWLKTDILYRAVPWSQLILSSGYMPWDLNLQTPHIISAVLVGLLTLTTFLIFLNPINLFGVHLNVILLILSFLLIFTIIILNRGLYGFFLQKRGIKFTILAIPIHFIYYFYSGVAFTLSLTLHKLDNLIPGFRKFIQSHKRKA